MADCGSVDFGSIPNKHTKRSDMRRFLKLDILLVILVFLFALSTCYYKQRSDMYKRMYDSYSYKSINKGKIDYVLIRDGRAI